ncbi:MAG: hydrolase or metal-binding protein [Saccharospirillum sp.]|uniref:recombination directionality factor n=1 Tax=Saccharospirillum sp. TaxID=2033801 RepID=UPI00329736DC
MIKGLAITPPTIGRISIGRMVEQNGNRLPQKDDQFTITTQIQGKDGWLIHPVDAELREQGKKLRTIPVRLLFNDPALNLRADYTFFDRKTGRPVCIGDGQQCRRLTNEGMESMPCPGPMQCEFGKGGLCKPYGRLNVRIGDDDETGTYIFRTTGFNSIRTLAARLQYFSAVSGNLLACMPLAMKLRGKSTTQSYRTPIYYADLTTREGMRLSEAIKEAHELEAQRQAIGFDQQALDDSAQQGFANAVYEDDEEDLVDIIEEYFNVLPKDDVKSKPVSVSKLKETLAASSKAS